MQFRSARGKFFNFSGLRHGGGRAASDPSALRGENDTEGAPLGCGIERRGG